MHNTGKDNQKLGKNKKEHAMPRNKTAFENFLGKKHIGDEAEIVPDLAQCWNAAVEACKKAQTKKEDISGQVVTQPWLLRE
ncbi:hypothetical protein KJ885_04450 [Patescibacteria group bacterium]|nr:hypothetical protein [Patescibacteria group bacterium]